MFNDDSAHNYYKLNFEMKSQYNFSLDEINSMTPYERDIYVSLIITDLQKKQNEQQQR